MGSYAWVSQDAEILEPAEQPSLGESLDTVGRKLNISIFIDVNSDIVEGLINSTIDIDSVDIYVPSEGNTRK